MKLLQGTKNRGVIYFFYDGDGIVDRYVTCMLREMKKCVKDLYVVINGTLTDDSRETLLGLTDCVWERENKGLDVGAYQYALKRIGWEKLETYDEVILMNHTIMGPVSLCRKCLTRWRSGTWISGVPIFSIRWIMILTD